jgi:hypothetical protein
VLVSVVKFIERRYFKLSLITNPKGSENPYFSAFIALATSLAVTKPIYYCFERKKDEKTPFIGICSLDFQVLCRF